MDDAAPAAGWRRLDPRYVRMAREAALLRLALWGGLLLVIGIVILWIADPGPPGIAIIASTWLLTVVVLGSLGFILPALRYRHSAWRIDGQFLELRTGAWWRTETRVPRSRIQHTDVGQGPIERRHGLGHLVLYTAGLHHGAVKLPGIDHGDAIALRDALLQGDERAAV
jgi:membrane protein YdbS with pleckstrin-like domain